MGRTHYWVRPTELPSKSFAKASAGAEALFNAIRMPLTSFNGIGNPVFSSDAIVFSGIGIGAGEPFEIHQAEFAKDGRKSVHSFCKTIHADYDMAVQCALIILKHHLGREIHVASDGKDGDWDRARSACQNVLGYGSEFCLDG